MRTTHIHHVHRPDWHHFGEGVRHVLRDPLFWAIVVLALILAALMFFAAMQPALPNQPYSPTYPYPVGYG